jgi:F-box protein 9
MGTWELQGTTINIRTLLDAAYLSPHMCNLDLSGSPVKERSAMEHCLRPNHLGTHPSLPAPRYNFQMLLELRSRPLGRWNKLELRAYESVAADSGEICGLKLKNERNFWFTRVKSWGW